MSEASGAENEPMPSGAKDVGPFFHGTKADLQPGDLLEPGDGSNVGERTKANFIYLTATLDAATWGAELAVGEGPGRIHQRARHATSPVLPRRSTRFIRGSALSG